MVAQKVSNISRKNVAWTNTSLTIWHALANICVGALISTLLFLCYSNCRNASWHKVAISNLACQANATASGNCLNPQENRLTKAKNKLCLKCSDWGLCFCPSITQHCLTNAKNLKESLKCVLKEAVIKKHFKKSLFPHNESVLS